MGVWKSTIPANTCVETSFPKCTGWVAMVPVHTCQREACRSPWAHSPHKRNAPRDVQCEVAGGRRWRHEWKLLDRAICGIDPCDVFAKATDNGHHRESSQSLTLDYIGCKSKLLTHGRQRKSRLPIKSERRLCKCVSAGRCIYGDTLRHHK